MSSKGHQYLVYARVATCVSGHKGKAIAVGMGGSSKVSRVNSHRDNMESGRPGGSEAWLGWGLWRPSIVYRKLPQSLAIELWGLLRNLSIPFLFFYPFC